MKLEPCQWGHDTIIQELRSQVERLEKQLKECPQCTPPPTQIGCAVDGCRACEFKYDGSRNPIYDGRNDE